MSKYIPCPCDSKLLYQKCCKVFHDGALPETAEQLMRSRYSAYALRNADYIMATTHPENPDYSEDKDTWRKSLLTFSDGTKFRGLEVREFIGGDAEAFVTFTARLSQAGQDASFTERSRFRKVGGRWLYHSGEIS